MKTALTIAGSDSSGGAGIQADIKTITLNGVFATSAITALTAQNTMGVKSVFETSPEFLKTQLDAVFEDIFPDAVKIGMVSSAKLVYIIADRLDFYKAKNVVTDPVMVATSGARLIKSDAIKALEDLIFPISRLITPNIPEAEILSGFEIKDKSDMEKAAKKLNAKYGCAVLLKGGHNTKNADDLLCANGELLWFLKKRINNKNTHGTGCTLSSAVAANLAKGQKLDAAIKNAKDYLSLAIEDMLDLGKGKGPINHAFMLKSKSNI